MSRNFHQDYADSVRNFCQSIPREVGVTTREVDAYFRSCALCLWSLRTGEKVDLIALNQIYTDEQVMFTSQQAEKALNSYRSDPGCITAAPAFFNRIVQADVRNQTSCSRTFAEVQKNLLMLCAAYDGTFTFDESRRITQLYHQLTAQCDRAGVTGISLTPGPEHYLNHATTLRSQAEHKTVSKLNDIMDEFSRVISRDTSRSMYDDFFGASTKAETVAPDSAAKAGISSEVPAQQSEEPAARETVQEEKEPEKPTLEEAMAELHALIGLDTVKKDVDSLVNLVKVRALRRQRGLKCPDMSFHLVFSGNPGTGKTTVARIIGKIFSALGLLSKGHLVEVDRSGLVAGYVGQTAVKTQEVIQKALGGVLFIDEAYSLAPENADKDFGQEAIDTILKAMEDHRDDFVVIVAGYASLMPRFIDSNPGLKSRFNKYLTFADYDADQLYEIFMGRVRSNDYRMDDEADAQIREYLKKLYEDRDDNFGNGRDVRNLFEKLVANQANRVAVLEAPSDEDILTITKKDFEGLETE